MSGSCKGVTVKELMSFFSYFQVWHKYLLFDGAGSGQGSKTQMDSKRLQTPISLSRLFINLQVWNHCPGHELSPKRTM